MIAVADTGFVLAVAIASDKENADIRQIAELLLQYADARVDFVDISVAVIAERLAIQRILTLDRRDFGMLRPRLWTSFELLPLVSDSGKV